MFPHTHQSNFTSRFWWLLIFVGAAILWSIDIGRPVDLPGWHEFDYSSIARNFVREGNNILYPRIDWRGSGPGFTEMEFPVIPWLMALLYQPFGIHEIIGRIISLLAMLSALWIFRGLALKVLPEAAAFVAALFFVVSHEISAVATAIQPESAMLLFYLLAAYYFVDWYESKHWLSYALALVSFAVAILVKSPAAHLAIFFFIWALVNDDLKAFRRPSLYLFALLSFAPALLWYAHASSLWHQFHNSMGVSNEDHWLGLDLLRRPKVIANLISIDLIFVFGIGGLLAAAAAILINKFNSAVNRLALSWCLAVAIYLIVILRTSGGYWAAYYHVVAVPPLALLFAAGVYQIQKSGIVSWQKLVAWVAAPAILFFVALLWLQKKDLSSLPAVLQDLVIGHTSIAMLLLLIVISALVTELCFSAAAFGPDDEIVQISGEPPAPLSAFLVVAGCFTYFLVSAQLLLGTWTTFSTRTPQFETAVCFRGIIPANTLIVASGGICQDAGGHRVANDAPDMFYWLDRKGFSTCEGNQNVAQLQGFASQGATYFVAAKNTLAKQTGLELELRKSFQVVADCKSALLFKLAAN